MEFLDLDTIRITHLEIADYCKYPKFFQFSQNHLLNIMVWLYGIICHLLSGQLITLTHLNGNWSNTYCLLINSPIFVHDCEQICNPIRFMLISATLKLSMTFISRLEICDVVPRDSRVSRFAMLYLKIRDLPALSSWSVYCVVGGGGCVMCSLPDNRLLLSILIFFVCSIIISFCNLESNVDVAITFFWGFVLCLLFFVFTKVIISKLFRSLLFYFIAAIGFF